MLILIVTEHRRKMLFFEDLKEIPTGLDFIIIIGN